MESERLRIAMLSVHSSPFGQLGTNDTGGMSVCIREAARKLGERGCSVDIFTRQTENGDFQTLNPYTNVRLIHLNAGRNEYIPKKEIYPLIPDLFDELELFRKREGIRYDCIHSHYWLSGEVGKIAQKKWNTKHIVTFHTLGAVKNAINGVEKEPELRITTEKRLIESCHQIIASTEREKEHLIRYYDASPDSIIVIPCGVNLNVFSPGDKSQSRHKLGFDQNESIFLYVGRFVPSKGPDRMLEAMRDLKTNKKLRLLIIGGDDHHTPEFQSLRKLGEQFGVMDRVNFVGRVNQEDLPVYYNAADFLVIPSRYESFGLVALESLACGTPVVATRVGAMDEIILEGKTGHLVTNGSPRFLAKGIEEFLSKSKDFPPHSIRDSIKKFDWENVSSRLVKVYEDTIPQQRAQVM